MIGKGSGCSAACGCPLDLGDTNLSEVRAIHPLQFAGAVKRLSSGYDPHEGTIWSEGSYGYGGMAARTRPRATLK